MAYRSTRPAHGKQNPTDVETLPPDELPAVNVDGLPVRWAKMVLNPGKGGRKNGMTTLGLSKDLINKGDPEYTRCIRSAKAYVNARRKEFFTNFGYVSVGVNAHLATSALSLAASRYLAQMAAVQEPGSKEQMDMLKVSASMSNASRISDMTAFEICKRESEVAKSVAATTGTPWLMTEMASGETKKRRPDRQMLNPAGAENMQLVGDVLTYTVPVKESKDGGVDESSEDDDI